MLARRRGVLLGVEQRLSGDRSEPPAAAVAGVAAQVVLEIVVGLGVAQAEIDGAVQALPEALLERDDLVDVHEVDLDRLGRADDPQVPGLSRGTQRPKTPHATAQLDPILVLAGQAGHVTPRNAEKACGVRFQIQRGVGHALDLADVGGAVVGRDHVGLVVVGRRGRGSEKQHESDPGSAHDLPLADPVSLTPRFGGRVHGPILCHRLPEPVASRAPSARGDPPHRRGSGAAEHPQRARPVGRRRQGRVIPSRFCRARRVPSFRASCSAAFPRPLTLQLHDSSTARMWARSAWVTLDTPRCTRQLRGVRSCTRCTRPRQGAQYRTLPCRGPASTMGRNLWF